MAKKLGRPFKHEMLSNPIGLTVLKDTVREPRCERSLRNLCYWVNVLGTLKKMLEANDDNEKEAARFWVDRYDKTPQGHKTLFYELGKIEEEMTRIGVIIGAHKLIRDNELTTKELKECIAKMRREASKQIPDDGD